MNEADLRGALADHASTFEPDPGRWDTLPDPKRANRRKAALGGALITAVAVGVAVFVAPFRTPDPTPEAGHPVDIHLVGYAAPSGDRMPITLRDHIQCMRDHGFAIPNPSWTGHGWQITLDDADSLGVGTRRWARTAFVTCALDVRGGRPPAAVRHAIMHPRSRADSR